MVPVTWNWSSSVCLVTVAVVTDASSEGAAPGRGQRRDDPGANVSQAGFLPGLPIRGPRAALPAVRQIVIAGLLRLFELVRVGFERARAAHDLDAAARDLRVLHRDAVVPHALRELRHRVQLLLVRLAGGLPALRLVLLARVHRGLDLGGRSPARPVRAARPSAVAAGA